jgi:hypothetical protein
LTIAAKDFQELGEVHFVSLVRANIMEAMMVHPAAKRRGADPHVPEKPQNQKPHQSAEHALEQALEETMAGSDAVSITQPKSDHTTAGRRTDANRDK